MALFTGTRIGADGRRYPVDAENIPDDADEERPKMVPVYGVPAEGETPVWNATRNRLEFSTGAGGEGGGGDVEARLTAVEGDVTTLETSVTNLAGLPARVTTLETTVSDLGDLPGRVDILETDTADMVISTTVTTIEQVTQAAYDALGTPDPATLYVIVG